MHVYKNRNQCIRWPDDQDMGMGSRSVLHSSQVSDHNIQFALLILALFTFLTLVWYAIETKRLRRAAEDQLEALAKPCLTLATELRAVSDAILEMHQAVGNTIAAGNGGYFVLHNIGSGVALNVTYRFKSLDPHLQADSSTRYFISVPPGHKIRMPEPMNASGCSGECELVFRFESIGRKTYQSTITMNHHVLTSFSFKSLGVPRRT